MPFTLPRSITVDFSTDADPQPIKAVQGDQTRVAKITLLNKGVPVNLTGLTVRAYVMPFGEAAGLYEDVAVTDATAGKVEYSLSGNACIKAGDGVVNIELLETATGKVAYTDEIPLKVKARKDFTGAIIGSTVFSALQTAIATALGLDAAAVHKAGAETITGLKSVPTPTAAEHIARKDYVDQNIAQLSATEHIVGKWIDGRVLYEKTVNCGDLPNATAKTTSHGVTGIGNIKFVHSAFAENINLSFNLPHTDTGAANYNISIHIDNTNIGIIAGVDRRGMNAWVTIRYVKA